ncbi:MAG TPA: hypothetical protein VFF20_05515 [Pseudogracilibacillus sp.]|nr:hypothetical protein [Pseudogracilibacillus sp.]
MGYYLPINDVVSEQYRKRVEESVKSPYYIERRYHIILDAIKRDDGSNRPLVYKSATKVKKEKQAGKERFSLEKGLVKGKGERINVQV